MDNNTTSIKFSAAIASGLWASIAWAMQSVFFFIAWKINHAFPLIYYVGAIIGARVFCEYSFWTNWKNNVSVITQPHRWQFTSAYFPDILRMILLLLCDVVLDFVVIRFALQSGLDVALIFFVWSAIQIPFAFLIGVVMNRIGTLTALKMTVTCLPIFAFVIFNLESTHLIALSLLCIKAAFFHLPVIARTIASEAFERTLTEDHT